ncbi:hypothetical protein [Devosia alba]|uniref:hypothetical protein n=1 Tax=Devosia alba TaxID=3152360 RepID=UPI00326419D5
MLTSIGASHVAAWCFGHQGQPEGPCMGSTQGCFRQKSLEQQQYVRRRQVRSKAAIRTGRIGIERTIAAASETQLSAIDCRYLTPAARHQRRAYFNSQGLVLYEMENSIDQNRKLRNVDAVYAAAVRVAEAAHKNGRKPLNEKHDEFKKLKLGLTKS